MSYLRTIRLEELVQWLESINYESTKDLAQMMIDKFDIIIESKTPS